VALCDEHNGQRDPEIIRAAAARKRPFDGQIAITASW
jgi:hypothetical protein